MDAVRAELEATQQRAEALEQQQLEHSTAMHDAEAASTAARAQAGQLRQDLSQATQVSVQWLLFGPTRRPELLLPNEGRGFMMHSLASCTCDASWTLFVCCSACGPAGSPALQQHAQHGESLSHVFTKPC